MVVVNTETSLLENLTFASQYNLPVGKTCICHQQSDLVARAPCTEVCKCDWLELLCHSSLLQSKMKRRQT